MADVVVLPWVPATAMVRQDRVISARVSARRSTGRPRRSASTSSGLVAGMAVEWVTASTSPTLAASWPTVTVTPRSLSRSTMGESFRSEPVTWWPAPTSTSAMALIPAPPTPTMWIRRG